MTTKKIIAICQSGGEFETDSEGSLSYSGGEAYAVDLDQKTRLSDFKKEFADTFQCGADAILVKYFLPGNKKTLITVSKDKDFQRMINFFSDGDQVELYVSVEEPAARTPANRATVSGAVVTTHVPINTLNGDDPIVMDIELQTTGDALADINGGGSHLKAAAAQWANLITGVDQRFRSFPEFREALRKYSMFHGFAYKYKKNDGQRVTAKCKSEGCPWRLYASRLPSTELVCIKKMNPIHTCERGNTTKAGHRASKNWVGSIIKEKLKVSPSYKAKEIANDIKNEYGIELNYAQVWRAKEMVREQMQGSYTEAYSHLPYICEKIMETNPGSVATFCTNEDSTFRGFFVSFHACITGFEQGCRPLLFLDSAQLYSKYQGTLLAAIAPDAEDDMFPVAFGVVDAETADNWHWFLSQLRSALRTPDILTFVADFRKGLRESLPQIFENCQHAYCLRYLIEKLNDDLKRQFSCEARRLMAQDFSAAACANKLEEFDQCAENLKAISPEAYNWVVRSEPEHWANAFFGGARYNHMTSSFGELFYSWAAEASELPITQMVDTLRAKIMEMIYTRRVQSSEWVSRLTPSIEERLQAETSKLQSLQVVLAHGRTFEVRGETVELVDTNSMECSCRAWQLNGLPCCHALAVFDCMGASPYDYCARYFTSESYRLTYAESIYPVPNVVVPVMSEMATQLAATITPPTKRPSGRPKMKPVGTLDIIKRQLTCSKCKGLGHNKRRCDMVQLEENGGSEDLLALMSPTAQ